MAANANKPAAKKKNDLKHTQHLELSSDANARAEKGELSQEFIEHSARWWEKRFSLPEVGEITGLRWQTIQAWIDRKHLEVGEFKHTRNKRLFSGFEVMQVRVVGDMSRIGIPPRIWKFVSDEVDHLVTFRISDPSPWQGLHIALYQLGKEWEMKGFYDTHPDEDRSYLPATVLWFDIDRLLYECRDRIDEIIDRQYSTVGVDEYWESMDTEAAGGA